MKMVFLGLCSLPHASQVYTAASELSKKKLVDVSFDSNNLINEYFSAEQSTQLNENMGVFCLIDSKRVFFDLHDSSNLKQEIIQYADVYFKRSFLAKGYSQTNVYPLGLNFEVYCEQANLNETLRLIRMRWPSCDTVKKKLTLFSDLLGITFLPRANYFSPQSCAFPDKKVLFLTRTWDPDEPSLLEHERLDRIKINQSRADLIQHLRDMLSDRFIGGFSNSQHAQQNFRQQIYENSELTKKKNYLKLVSNIPVCISSVGLHGSLGWKFGEYVALGRAVVSENTDLAVPYDFTIGKNYLSYGSNEECIEKIELLLQNENNISSLMNENYKYSENYLVPHKWLLSAFKSAGLL